MTIREIKRPGGRIHLGLDLVEKMMNHCQSSNFPNLQDGQIILNKIKKYLMFKKMYGDLEN